MSESGEQWEHAPDEASHPTARASGGEEPPPEGPGEGRDGELSALPADVRARVVAVASDVLGSLPLQETPLSLRPFRSFAPRRRQQHAAQQLLAETQEDDAFRRAVADELLRRSAGVGELLSGAEAEPPEAETLEAESSEVADAAEAPQMPGGEDRRALSRERQAGQGPVEGEDDDATAVLRSVIVRAEEAGLDVVDVAAAAYLNRPPGWQEIVADLAAQVGELRESAELVRYRRRVADLEERLASALTERRTLMTRHREELAQAKAQADRVRAALAEEKARARRVERERDDLQLAHERLLADRAAEQDQARRREATLRRERDDALAQRDEIRRQVQTGEAEATSRLWLLLDTAERAVSHIRRELNVIAPEGLPRDFVVARHTPSGRDTASSRAIADEVVLREVLGQPRAYLIVDGYNITKSAYGELTLEDQRARLVTALGALGARTGADVTCVFDGTERPPGASQAAKGVFVVFSQGGQNADGLIRELVGAEPPGRVVVVASSDGEVVADARRAGCYTVSSQVLAAALEGSARA